MKVLMPSRILDKNVGGNTTYARELASRLPAHGFTVDVMRAGRNPVHTMVLESLQSMRPLSDSVLHFVADTGPLFRPRVPSIVTVHGVASRWISTARNQRQEYIWRSRVGAAIRFCDHVITVSQSSADDIAEIFEIERSAISVIPHGISSQSFEAPNAVSDHVAASLPSNFILYVGNIEPRKNIIELIRAVEDDESLPMLVIAGKPAWNFTDSMEAIGRAKRVVYLGFVSDEDRAALMKLCDAFVFPSLYEGFGFPVLEAMAAGAPVITTDRGSLKEVAGPAWILEGTDREAIATGIKDALNDPAWLQRSPSAGAEWAASFSWDESVRQHAAAYRRVAK